MFASIVLMPASRAARRGDCRRPRLADSALADDLSFLLARANALSLAAGNAALADARPARRGRIPCSRWPRATRAPVAARAGRAAAARPEPGRRARRRPAGARPRRARAGSVRPTRQRRRHHRRGTRPVRPGADLRANGRAAVARRAGRREPGARHGTAQGAGLPRVRRSRLRRARAPPQRVPAGALVSTAGRSQERPTPAHPNECRETQGQSSAGVAFCRRVVEHVAVVEGAVHADRRRAGRARTRPCGSRTSGRRRRGSAPRAASRRCGRSSRPDAAGR